MAATVALQQVRTQLLKRVAALRGEHSSASIAETLAASSADAARLLARKLLVVPEKELASVLRLPLTLFKDWDLTVQRHRDGWGLTLTPTTLETMPPLELLVRFAARRRPRPAPKVLYPLL